MNVLFFVIIYLMLLSILTYGRLENYRSFALMQKAFLQVMQTREPEFFARNAIKFYQTTPATSKDESDDPENPRNPASSKLSFNLFVSETERQSNGAQLQGAITAAKNLIEYLYKGEAFYQKAELERGDLANEIIQALMTASTNWSPDYKWYMTKEIANVDLQDPLLNEVFTKMLKGTDQRLTLMSQGLKPNYLPISGAFPLEDFITVMPKKLKIRVYLASSQLLMALFQNQETVSSILQARRKIYNDLRNNSEDKSGSDQLKSQFFGQQAPGIPDDMLDWGVSKTNPAGYE